MSCRVEEVEGLRTFHDGDHTWFLAPGGRVFRRECSMSFRDRLISTLALTMMLTSSLTHAGVKMAMDLDLAMRVLTVAEAEATRLGAPGAALAVVDDGGHLVAFERLEGTFPAAAAVAIGKARTAATFQRPTALFEEAIQNGRVSLTAVPEMVPLQGGVPIVIDGQVIGAIGVSGAASARQDTEIAEAAANGIGRELSQQGGKQ